jgi:hypothetical protein
MGIHNILPAQRVSDWSAVVGKLPQPLADLIVAFEEVSYALPPHTGLDTNGLTVKSVPAAVEKLANDIAVASHFKEAQTAAKAALADAVLIAASDAVPAILKGLAPKFQTAVQAYTAAVQALPDPVTSDVLVASDPAVLAAYQNAVTAAATIKAIDGWLASLAEVPEHGSNAPQPELRVINATNRSELAAVMNAKAKSDAEDKLVPRYLVAVRSGIGFQTRTPVEASALRAEIDGMPVVRKPIQFARLMSR